MKPFPFLLFHRILLPLSCMSFFINPVIQNTLADKVAPFSTGLAQKIQTKTSFIDLPLSFEPNLGQSSNLIRFLSRGPKHSLLLLDNKLILRYSNSTSDPQSRTQLTMGKQSSELQIKFVDANSSPRIVGEKPLKAKSHYFRGSNPEDWKTNIPNACLCSF